MTFMSKLCPGGRHIAFCSHAVGSAIPPVTKSSVSYIIDAVFVNTAILKKIDGSHEDSRVIFHNRKAKANADYRHRRAIPMARIAVYFVSFPITPLRNVANRFGDCLFSRFSHSRITAYPP